MTRHRLVRCAPATLLRQVWHHHPENGLDCVDAAPWLGHSPRPRQVARWRQRLPGNRSLDCWLEIEESAHGVLAHLSAAPSPEVTWLLPSRLSRIAVEAWSARELAALARDAEAAASA